MCAEAPCNGSVASSSETEHNVWLPLLGTLVENQTEPMLLSFLKDAEAVRLDLTSRLALHIFFAVLGNGPRFFETDAWSARAAQGPCQRLSATLGAQ